MTAIRLAEPTDVPEILNLVRELADYVGATGQVTATEQSLHDALFTENPSVFAHVVDMEGEADYRIGGFSLWYLTFSTWLGKYGAWIDDLYVRPELRGAGLGTSLFVALQQLCTERGYGRMEWTVYDWNEPAITFYKGHGAIPKDEFTVFRLDGKSLRALDDAATQE